MSVLTRLALPPLLRPPLLRLLLPLDNLLDLFLALLRPLLKIQPLPPLRVLGQTPIHHPLLPL